MHWTGKPFGGAFFEPEHATRTAAGALQEHAGWGLVALYYIGIVSTCYHFANGLWTFLITWGITIGPQSQKKAGYVCAAIGVGLTLWGLVAMRGFLTYELEKAPEAATFICLRETG